MAELKRIKVHLFLILGLQFTGCTITRSSVFMRSGDDMVLSCQNVISGQIKCNGTTWVYSRTSGSVELVTLGQVDQVQRNSDRLSVAANCSLVMRSITVEDAGYYQCQQYKSEADPSKHILVHQSLVSLSVVHMTEQKETDTVTLTCSVETRGACGSRVTWQHDCSTGNEINCTVRHSGCSAAVCFIERSLTQSCEFQCEVTNAETKQIFNFNHQSTEHKSGFWSGAPYVAAAVFSVALLTAVAVFVIRWRNKRNTKQVHVYDEVNPTVPESTTTQETSKENVEPEDGVYYSTIREAPVRFNVVGESDDMTYSTVGSPRPPADPSGIYFLLTAPGK
ncbi:uncharacterized protein LOC129356481 [Poeciliopsis prolifica]|uniref:uncharacterized protein LOC129356481 n=1 Tax=Poeciliopsis prolifica TaxID=188132 RepID=UPI002413F354|nr:uncharacterized protein LOC129356481 [Poeciliopsis prolifica]